MFLELALLVAGIISVLSILIVLADMLVSTIDIILDLATCDRLPPNLWTMESLMVFFVAVVRCFSSVGKLKNLLANFFDRAF